MKTNLRIKYQGFFYTPQKVSEMMKISVSAASHRIRAALALETSLADVFRKKRSDRGGIKKEEEGIRLPPELTREQFETLREFDRLTRNDDRLIKKYYA